MCVCVTPVAKDSLVGLCYELESMSEHICQAGGCPTLEESAFNKEVLQSVLIWFRDAGTTYLQSFCDWQGAKPRTPSSQLVSSVLCNMSCQSPVQFSVGDLHICAHVCVGLAVRMSLTAGALVPPCSRHRDPGHRLCPNLCIGSWRRCSTQNREAMFGICGKCVSVESEAEFRRLGLEPGRSESLLSDPAGSCASQR